MPSQRDSGACARLEHRRLTFPRGSDRPRPSRVAREICQRRDRGHRRHGHVGPPWQADDRFSALAHGHRRDRRLITVPLHRGALRLTSVTGSTTLVRSHPRILASGYVRVRLGFSWSIGAAICATHFSPCRTSAFSGPPAIGARLQASQSGCSVAGNLTQRETDQHQIRASSSPPARPRRSFTARFCGSAMPSRTSEALRPWSAVVSRCRCHRISEDLGAQGVPRLMVEGGGKVHTKFLTANLVDELHPRALRSFGARPGSSAGAQRSTAVQRRSTALTDCSRLSPCQPDRTTSHSASCRRA